MTKTTWHINGCATSSRECSMYWSSRLHSVHCTMTLMSTCCGFLTPKTLYKPLPPPPKYPYPWKGYGFASGKGKGRCENTHRLPVPITKTNYHPAHEQQPGPMNRLSPGELIQNPGATSWSTTWQPNDEWRHWLLFIIAVYFRHHGECPPSHVCPNPLCWDTGNIEPRLVRDMVQPCDEDNNDMTRTRHDNDPTQGDKATMVHGNNNTWQWHDQDTGWWGNHDTQWWQHTRTRWHQHSTTMDKDPAPSPINGDEDLAPQCHHYPPVHPLFNIPPTSPSPLSTLSLTFPLHPPSLYPPSL